MPMTELATSVRVIEFVAVVSAEPVEENQADSVGRFWFVRVPSAQVSARNTVARPDVARRIVPAKRIEICRRRIIWAACVSVSRENITCQESWRDYEGSRQARRMSTQLQIFVVFGGLEQRHQMVVLVRPHPGLLPQEKENRFPSPSRTKRWIGRVISRISDNAPTCSLSWGG